MNRIQGEPRVVSIQVGTPREFAHNGKQVTSSIWKLPVEGPVAARGVNLAGDDQADREAHGGPDKAVYAYALQDLRFWEAELGRPLDPGAFGENLSISGMDLTGALVGERWEIGTARFEVSEPRVPCWKLGVRMEDPAFPRRFSKEGRPGAYLRILREGVLTASDPIRIAGRPSHGVSVGKVFRIYTLERDQAGVLLSVPELSGAWKAWAQRRLER